MKELLEWAKEKEKDAQDYLTLTEVMGCDESDRDYAQGLYEAYGVVINKVQEALNGTN